MSGHVVEVDLECNARDWIEGDPLGCQASGTDGQVVIPVDVAWTGYGVEWKPAKGGAVQRPG